MHTDSRALPGSRKIVLPIIEILFRKLPKKLEKSPKNPPSATHKWIFSFEPQQMINKSHFLELAHQKVDKKFGLLRRPFS